MKESCLLRSITPLRLSLLLLGCLVLGPWGTYIRATEPGLEPDSTTRAARTDLEWRNLRGPSGDGSAGSAVELSSLSLGWKRQIGPGYSGVTIGDGRVVSAFSDGTHDVVAAWSAEDGEELWRVPIAPTYRGHDGSSDGPIGTPTIAGERVYFLGPRGDLVAISARSGEITWRKHVETEWQAHRPVYGFGANALEVDRVLVVPGGTGEHAVLGLDPADGSRLWSVGELGVTYATPVLAHGDLLIASARDVLSVDAQSGTLRWTFRHSDEAPFDPTYPQLQPLDDGFLLFFKNEAVRYRRSATGVVAEVWRSHSLKSSVAIPVVHAGHLFGFSGTFLTCVDLETGDTVWKSRSPRSRGLILVGEQLVMLGSGGQVTMARADPAGYRETATLTVSDHGGYTAPSFAGGRVYVRNRTELVSVVVGSSASDPIETSSASRASSGEFNAWMQRIEQAVDREPAIREFLEAQSSFPILEPGWVHFVYAGDAGEVSIIGQMNDDEIGEPMMRLADTDLFVRSYPSVPGGRWQYRFQVDFADPIVDPRNQHRGSGGFFETSEILFDGFEDPAFVTDAPSGEGGRLETLTVASEAYGFDVESNIYLPAGYDDAKKYPLVVLPNGEQWIEAGGIVRILDNLFESTHEPAIVALVSMQGWVGGSWGKRAVELLGRELLPKLESVYSIADGSDRRSLWTVEDKAAVGLQLASMSPQPYGRFAFQSPKLYFREPIDVEVFPSSTKFWVSWSRYEPLSAETGVDDRAAARDLESRLENSGFELRGGEFVAGPGYRTWRREAEVILELLLGTASDEEASGPIDSGS